MPGPHVLDSLHDDHSITRAKFIFTINLNCNRMRSKNGIGPDTLKSQLPTMARVGSSYWRNPNTIHYIDMFTSNISQKHRVSYVMKKLLVVSILLFFLTIGLLEGAEGQIVVHSEVNGVTREEYITDAGRRVIINGEIVEDDRAPQAKPTKISEIKFKGEVLRGGEDEDGQVVSFYKFVIKVDEVLEDPKNQLSVGDLLGVSSHRSGQARVDTVYNGDNVEVFGEYQALPDVHDDHYWDMDLDGCVYLSKSFGDGEDYYLKEIGEIYPEEECSGTISGHVYDDATEDPIEDARVECEGSRDYSSRSGYYSIDEEFCSRTRYTIRCSADGYISETKTRTTDSDGDAEVDFSLEPIHRCSGTISGYVYDGITRNPIRGASVRCEGHSDDSSQRGYYSIDGEFCPRERYSITCSAEGYKSETESITTDSDGDYEFNFYLVPECEGTISGHAYDANTREPIEDALIECGGSNTDSRYTGYYSLDGDFCPSTRYSVKCSAEDYKLDTESITTDDDGDYTNLDFYLEPKCSGSISGHVRDSVTRSPVPGASLLVCEDGGTCFALPPVDSNGVYSTDETICPSTRYEITCDAEGYEQATKTKTTDQNGNAWVDFDLESECSDTISGHVRDSVTRSPVPGASLLVCEEGGSCFALPPVDSNGVYSTDGPVCPSTVYEITCDAEGYEQATKTKTTDLNGNAWVDFDLESECSGSISGHVRDSVTRSPVRGASLLVCENGGGCFALPPVDSNGVYSTDVPICPSIKYEITCDAEGYEQTSMTRTTDENGNAWVDFSLEPSRKASVSGKVVDAITNMPVQGAKVTVCLDGTCLDRDTDSAGSYSVPTECKRANYDVTCSAEGYETYESDGATNTGGVSVHDILLEPSCKGSIVIDPPFDNKVERVRIDENEGGYPFRLLASIGLLDSSSAEAVNALAEENAAVTCQADDRTGILRMGTTVAFTPPSFGDARAHALGGFTSPVYIPSDGHYRITANITTKGMEYAAGSRPLTCIGNMLLIRIYGCHVSSSKTLEEIEFLNETVLAEDIASVAAGTTISVGTDLYLYLQGIKSSPLVGMALSYILSTLTPRATEYDSTECFTESIYLTEGHYTIIPYVSIVSAAYSMGIAESEICGTDFGFSDDSLGYIRINEIIIEKYGTVDQEYTADYWIREGDTLYDLGKYDEATYCYDEVIKLDPEDAIAWNKKGLALVNLGEYDEAAHCLDRAEELGLA